jgi:hypothetical protein
MFSSLLFAILPLTVTAFTCAPSVPAATCSSLASVFSSQWRNQTRIPTITITLKNPPASTVAPQSFSPATSTSAPQSFLPVKSSSATPQPFSPARSSATPQSFPPVNSPSPAKSSSPTVISSNWPPRQPPSPTTPPRLPSPSPSQSRPRPVSSASLWSTCIDSSPLTCHNLLCTNVPGSCTPWVEGDGPERELCIDGEPARCEGSECAIGADVDDDVSPTVCRGWVDPQPTYAGGLGGDTPAGFAPPWAVSASPRPRVYSTLPTGFLGGSTTAQGTGFVTVTVTRSGLGPWVGM